MPEMSEMSDFVQQRHKPTVALSRPRELIVALPPMRSNVNISRIMRTASCSGVRRMICAGTARRIAKIARETSDSIELELHRTLPPVLKRLQADGHELVGLEQATGSASLFEFPFKRKTVLIIGNERQGIEDDVLRLLDHTVEIPVYGLPFSHNAATAAAMAIYEYCRQYPSG